jgi:two-component system OmpR family sensor kinase
VRLRRRLTLTVTVLLILGLAFADVVTYVQVRSYLYGHVDEQLDVAQHQAYSYLFYVADHGRPPKAAAIDFRVSPDVYVEVIGSRGRVVLSVPSGSPSSPDPAPILPARLRVQPSPPGVTFGRHHGVYRPDPDSFTVGGHGDRTAVYRATAVIVPQGTLVTAVSLNPTLATLDSLVRIELLASLAAVVALAILALWTVRRGLRPLEEMTQVAGAIAAGDLTRRIPSDDPATEVGRLGSALNVMLGRIEASFHQKDLSEERLHRFVADASHELRTPLTSIRGYTELLRKGAYANDDDRRRALTRVEEEATRMGMLVDDLLLLAHLDEGRDFARNRVDLVKVCADAVDDARAVEPSRRITLEVNGPVTVVADADRMGQVVHNLVRNGITHSAASTPLLVRAAEEDGWGVVHVVDRGPGLTAEETARVFDRFYRADPARTGPGTGLGLAIVQAIVERFGGTAAVVSTPGNGADFSVRLPLAAPGTEGPPAGRRPSERSRRSDAVRS